MEGPLFCVYQHIYAINSSGNYAYWLMPNNHCRKIRDSMQLVLHGWEKRWRVAVNDKMKKLGVKTRSKSRASTVLFAAKGWLWWQLRRECLQKGGNPKPHSSVQVNAQNCSSAQILDYKNYC